MENTIKHAVAASFHALAKDVVGLSDSKDPNDVAFSRLYQDACSHVSQVVRTRGIEYALVQLPKACKLFDKHLSSGYYQRGAIVDVLQVSPTSSIMKMLDMTVPSRDRNPNQDVISTSVNRVNPNYIFFIRQLFLMWKKIDMDCPKAATQAAIEEFISIELGLRQPDGPWGKETWVSPQVTFRRQFGPHIAWDPYSQEAS